MTRPATTVVVLAATDPAERETALLTALLDAPDVVAVVHDLERDGGGVTLVRRLLDPTRPTVREVVPLEHACPGCALREDAVPTIAALLARPGGPPRGIVLALPLNAEILPATRSLLEHAGPDGLLDGVRLGRTVAVLRGASAHGELLDGDEGLLSHLVSADTLVVTDGAAAPVVEALRWRGSERYDDGCLPWLDSALAGDHDDVALERRHDPASQEADDHPVRAGRTSVDGGEDGVWTLELRSDRPLHPARVLDLLPRLATEHTVSRGRFWLPNRPDAVCGWEALGGTVRVGVAGPWEEQEPSTLLRVVGSGPGRADLVAAFRAALLDDAEASAGPAAWLGREDPFEPYLGSPAELYRTE